MASVSLSIEPDLCGPVSVGTVAVILVIRERLGQSLADAASFVNRAVFDGETVSIPAPSAAAAVECAAALTALSTPAKVQARAEVD